MADQISFQSGELIHAIDIQAPQYGGAGDGRGSSLTPTYSNVRSTRGRIMTAGGRETSQAAQIVSEVSHVVKVRYTSTVIKANYRVQFGVRFFTVLYVENVLERNRVMLLYCMEVDGGGQ